MNFDEVLYSNVALGSPIDSFFDTYRLQNLNFVVHLYYYIGSIKAYLFKFIFYLFGSSVYTVRIPMLVLFSFCFWFSICFLKNNLNQRTVFISLLFLILNVDYFNYIIYDVGPNGLELFVKTFVIYLIFTFKRRNIFLTINLIGIFCLLGVFNKLNFTWQVNSILIAIFVYYKKEITNDFINNKKLFIFKISIILIYLFLILYYVNFCFKRYSWESKVNFDFIEIGTQFKILILQTLGLDFNSSILSGEYSVLLLILGVFLNISLFIYFLFLIFKKKNKTSNKIFVFFYLIFILNILQIIVTFEANRSWHIYSAVFPSIPICLAIFFINVNDKYKIFTKPILALFCIFLITNNFYGFYLKSKEPKSIAWSSSFYDLSSYLKNTNKKVIINDWGFTSGLLVYDPKKNKYFHKCYGCELHNKQVKDEVKDWILINYKNFLIVSHGVESKIKCENVNFELFLNELGYKLKLKKKFIKNNKSIIEIHEINKINE